LPLNRLQEFDAGGKFDQSFRGERIPTLHEVFESVGKATFTNIELTNYASPRDSLPEMVAEIVKQHGLEKRVMFSSFNPINLRRIHKILPDVPKGQLPMPGFGYCWTKPLIRRWFSYQALHLSVNDTHSNFVSECHQRGIRVYVHTVNHPDTMHKLFELGVNGIFTDDPLLGRQIRTSYPVTK
jgi:glycerophosphoryl diester phosphodiesterase